MKRLCLLLLALLFAGQAAAENFRIDEIRVEGLQRISEGNVFSFMAVEVGDTLTPALARSTIRDLYRTGFFNDIALSREGATLVITVQERPAIAEISISGNRQLKTDDLIPALAGIGIAEGEIFDPLSLDRVRQELVRQYFGRGYYGVDVDTRVTRLARNRVNLAIVIEERRQARIRHINIVGNEQFSRKALMPCGRSTWIAASSILRSSPLRYRSARTSRISSSPPIFARARYLPSAMW